MADHFKVNRNDIFFILKNQLNYGTLCSLARYKDLKEEMLDMVVSEAITLAREVVDPLQAIGEKWRVKFERGKVSCPPEFKKLEKAKKAFKPVQRLEKNFVPATLGLAEVLLRENENEEAINLLEKSYEETFSMIILARLEDLLINIGEPGRLLRIYKNTLLKNPQNPGMKFFLGKLYYRLEMIDDAFDTLSSIDTGHAAYPELHQLMGTLYLKRHQPDKAVHEFRKALDMKVALKVPYCCMECGNASTEWSGRCESCKKWNTLQFNLDDACKL